MPGRFGGGTDGTQWFLQECVRGPDGGLGRAHGTQVGSAYKGKADLQGSVWGWALDPSRLISRHIKTWKATWEAGLGGQRRTL